MTIVPLSIYFKKGMAKVELSIARGRKTYDKREALKKQDAKREIDRAMRRRSDDAGGRASCEPRFGREPRSGICSAFGQPPSHDDDIVAIWAATLGRMLSSCVGSGLRVQRAKPDIRRGTGSRR